MPWTFPTKSPPYRIPLSSPPPGSTNVASRNHAACARAGASPSIICTQAFQAHHLADFFEAMRSLHWLLLNPPPCRCNVLLGRGTDGRDEEKIGMARPHIAIGHHMCSGVSWLVGVDRDSTFECARDGFMYVYMKRRIHVHMHDYVFVSSKRLWVVI
jgi:hypothetical protein